MTSASEVHLKLMVVDDVLIEFSRGVTMKCPRCGSARPVHGTRDMPYTYKGELAILPQVTGALCSDIPLRKRAAEATGRCRPCASVRPLL